MVTFIIDTKALFGIFVVLIALCVSVGYLLILAQDQVEAQKELEYKQRPWDPSMGVPTSVPIPDQGIPSIGDSIRTKEQLKILKP